MKDYLLDLIQYTYDIGVIELVKVSGTATETKIAAASADRNVIIYGDFNSPIAAFEGVFGMPNLSKLKTILGFDDYGEDSTIDIIREVKDGEDGPVRIHFETATGDFVNAYRLMMKNAVEGLVNDITFKGATWHVEFEPTTAGILRLKKQSQANSEEITFTAKTDNGDLKIYFGDPASHSGNFVFQAGVTGNLTRPWRWPVKAFLSIMDLPGDKKIRLSDDGVIEVTVDSNLSIWKYLLPALTK